MKCLNQKCNATDIENDDNFCYKCGHWTTKGYSFLKDKNNIKMILNGATIKQQKNISTIILLLGLFLIIFTVIIFYRGDNILRPFSYLKKQTLNYIYGYNSSLIKTDNKYINKQVNTDSEAINLIKKDFNSQRFHCLNKIEVNHIEYKLEQKYSIPSVCFCDMTVEQSKKIESIIDRIYTLFPNIKGALTNITISNMNKNENEESIAYFQPMYQFININQDIQKYNKVNKTQILLNSYYYLNNKSISKKLKNWYVEDATGDTTIAHELGHYISFSILLKKYNINNIILESKDNENIIKTILKEYNNGIHSKEIIELALNNYNLKNEEKLDIESFSKTISNYASIKDKKGNIIYEETIAEAIHDYYLHDDNMKDTTKEIIQVIRNKL